MENIATIEEKSIFDSTDFDEIAELKALVRSLKRAEHFSLLFARSNQRPKQKELMEKVISELPKKKIEVIYFENGIKNLLDELRTKIDDEKPDAVFIYGLESSMPKSEIAHKTPFVKNLNASRNAFPSVIDCPIVFWLPDYGITAIMNGAPDFFSVRSGVFFFENNENKMSQQISQAISTGYKEQDSLLLKERQERIKTLLELLNEYQSLTENKRNFQTEYELKDKLADLYRSISDFSKAEKLRKELLEEAKEINAESVVHQIHELSEINLRLGNDNKALYLALQALESAKNLFGKNSFKYATHLEQLGIIYFYQERYYDAAQKFNEVLDIEKHIYGDTYQGSVAVLNGLGISYYHQKMYDKAVEYFEQGLKIAEKNIDKEYPLYARILNNLGNGYGQIGRSEEAIVKYKESLEVAEKLFGKNHYIYAHFLGNLAVSYWIQKKHKKAVSLFDEVFRILMKVFGEDHPDTQKARRRLELVREEAESKNADS